MSELQPLHRFQLAAARIRQAADSSVGTPGEGETVDGTKSQLSKLCAVMKEIVDMQLELYKQENARPKTKTGHLALDLTRDLEDTRPTLSDVGCLSCYNRFDACVISLFIQERERAASVAAQHAELVERIQQLNLYVRAMPRFAQTLRPVRNARVSSRSS